MPSLWLLPIAVYFLNILPDILIYSFIICCLLTSYGLWGAMCHSSVFEFHLLTSAFMLYNVVNSFWKPCWHLNMHSKQQKAAVLLDSYLHKSVWGSFSLFCVATMKMSEHLGKCTQRAFKHFTIHCWYLLLAEEMQQLTVKWHLCLHLLWSIASDVVCNLCRVFGWWEQSDLGWDSSKTST